MFRDRTPRTGGSGRPAPRAAIGSVHVAAFGPDPERRRRCIERAFKGVFRVFKAQTSLCALDGETVVGATGIAPAGTCQATLRQRIGMLPVMIAMGPSTASRVGKWLNPWADRDPAEPHSHLCPLAVLPATRRFRHRRLPGNRKGGERPPLQPVRLRGCRGGARDRGADWFMRRPPRPRTPPTGAWINKPDTEETAH
jgi:hypothetical protein